MARKRASKVTKNDFEYDEGEVCGFINEAPRTNTQVNTTSASKRNTQNNISNPIEIKTTLSSTKDIFTNTLREANY